MGPDDYTVTSYDAAPEVIIGAVKGRGTPSGKADRPATAVRDAIQASKTTTRCKGAR